MNCKLLSSCSVKALILVAGLCLFGADVFAGSFTSSTSGNWTTPATWGFNGNPTPQAGVNYPGVSDDVTINNDMDVVINSAVECKMLTINAATQGNRESSLTIQSGSLLVNNTVALTGGGNGNKKATLYITGGALTINGNVSINSIDSYLNLNGGTSTFGGSINISTAGGVFEATGGTAIFNASGTQNVPAATYNNLTISGSGDKVLQGNATVNGTLSFTGGNLTTLNPTNNTLTMGSAATVTGETTTSYYKGKLVKSVAISGQNSYNFGTMGLVFDNTGATGGGNWGTVTVTRTTNSAIVNPGDDTKESIKRFWHISPSIQAGTNVNVTFKWFTTEDNGRNFTSGQAQAWKSTDNGLTWTPVGNLATITTAGNERTVNISTTSFSIWTFSDPNTPLPVSWLYFNGKANDKGNDLTWATASEKNSAAFEVERSANGKNFEKIGTVKAAGNSNQVINYTFTDKQPLAGITTYYRLKQTDLDGAYEYSSMVAIAKNDRLAKVINVYPNPFGKTLNLQLNPNNAVRKVVLMGLDGKVVYSRNLEASAETVLSDLPDLNTGLYLLQLISDSGTTTLKVAHE